MPLIDTLNKTSRDLRLSDKFQITHLNSPTVFEAANGMIGTTIKLDGVPFDTERNDVINANQRLWKLALKGLQETIALHVTIHRYKVNPLLDGEFFDEFTAKLNAKYERKYRDTAVYQNSLYLTVIYKGITSGKSGKFINKITRLSEMAVKKARAFRRKEQMKSLEKVVFQITSLLSKFNPTILGTRDEAVGYSELLKFLSLTVNGGKSLPFKLPTISLPIETISNIKRGLKKYPIGHIGQYLCGHRIFFGKAIQFQGESENNSHFASMISIKRYPDQTLSIILDSLLHIDAEFISTHTFAVEARDVALKLVDKQVTRLNSVEDKGKSQIFNLNTLLDDVASGNSILGYHHHSLMIISDSIKALDKKTTDAIRLYGESGIMAIREDIGQEPAFFAQIPTNFKYIPRSVLISGDNFTDFCPLHNYRTGYRDGNHLGGAVTLLETPAKTPYFFNYHLASSNKSVTSGHTMIIGGNGAGKTALMTFLDSQMSRYGGRAFVFDRKRGFELYIKACGGYYTTLSPNEKAIQFNPLQLPDLPTNRKFCQDWLAQLVKAEGEISLDPEIMEQLKNLVDYSYNHLAKEHRTLTNISKMLPINFPRWASLRRWLKANGKHGDGEYAYIFDNPVDTFSLDNDKMGFDMTHFLDNESQSSVRTAVMMYIMHRLILSMNGRLLTIYMDEGWQFLKDPYWLKAMEMFLASFRSKNGHLVFSTQTPETVITSAIHPVIMANIATQIFFCNDKASAKDYVDGFKLSQEEFSAIYDTPVSRRLFLVKQGNQSIFCRLNLSGLSQELPILSPSESDLTLFDKIRFEVGDDPKAWLPVFLERVAQP